jgi:hypothetical protein
LIGAFTLRALKARVFTIILTLICGSRRACAENDQTHVLGLSKSMSRPFVLSSNRAYRVRTNMGDASRRYSDSTVFISVASPGGMIDLLDQG